MTFKTVAQGARSQLALKKQSAGGTQATGNYSRLRFNTHSFNTRKDVLVSEEIRADREVQDARHGHRNGAGTVGVELCFADHDTLIESAFFRAFNGGAVKVGTDPQYLSIEDQQLDLGLYRMFVNQLVSRAQFQWQNTAAGAIVSASFDLVGTDGSSWQRATQAGTLNEPTNNKPFDSFSGTLFDHSDISSGNEIATVTSLTLTIDNGANALFGLTQKEGLSLDYDRGNISGQVGLFFENELMSERFYNETEGGLVMSNVDPAGNAMQWRMNRILYNAADTPVQNRKARMITMPFQVMRDSTTGYSLSIDKTASS